jgi:hypothetical protein
MRKSSCLAYVSTVHTVGCTSVPGCTSYRNGVKRRLVPRIGYSPVPRIGYLLVPRIGYLLIPRIGYLLVPRIGYLLVLRTLGAVPTGPQDRPLVWPRCAPGCASEERGEGREIEREEERVNDLIHAMSWL